MPFPESNDIRIVGRAFHAAVVGMIIVRAVLVVFAIRFVMFVVVGDQVLQREAVMRGNKVDARRWPAPVPLIQVAAASEPVS